MQLLPNGEIINYFTDQKRKKYYPSSLITLEGICSFEWESSNHAGPEIPVHLHNDKFEFIYVEKGSLILYIGQTRYSLKGGDVFVIKPGELHSSAETPTPIHDSYFFTLRNSGNILGINEQWSKSLLNRLLNLNNRILHPKDNLAELLSCVLKGVAVQNEFYRQTASAKLLYFLYRIIECDIIYETKILSDDISEAVRYINTNICEKLSLEVIAEICNLSLSRFKHKFRNEVGITPMEYINQQKIEEAKKLFEQGWSVTDTAYELDFTSSSYFSVVFKRVTSITATEYKEKIILNYSGAAKHN